MTRATAPYKGVFTLSNNCQEELTVDVKRLPYAYPCLPYTKWNAIITNQTTGVATSLKMDEVFNDLPFGNVVLKPLESITEELDFRRLIPSLTEILKTNSVELSWTNYSGNDKSVIQLTGKLLMPKVP